MSTSKREGYPGCKKKLRVPKTMLQKHWVGSRNCAWMGYSQAGAAAERWKLRIWTVISPRWAPLLWTIGYKGLKPLSIHQPELWTCSRAVQTCLLLLLLCPIDLAWFHLMSLTFLNNKLIWKKASVKGFCGLSWSQFLFHLRSWRKWIEISRYVLLYACVNNQFLSILTAAVEHCWDNANQNPPKYKHHMTAYLIFLLHISMFIFVSTFIKYPFNPKITTSIKQWI